MFALAFGAASGAVSFGCYKAFRTSEAKREKRMRKLLEVTPPEHRRDHYHLQAVDNIHFMSDTTAIVTFGLQFVVLAGLAAYVARNHQARAVPAVAGAALGAYNYYLISQLIEDNACIARGLNGDPEQK